MSHRQIPLFKVFMNLNTSAHLNETLQSGYVGQGKKVKEFENILSQYLDAPFVSTTNSATSGIHLCLHLIKLLDKKNRNEVITTPLTCVATNFPIVANNLKIIWADLDIKTCNINLDDVKQKITSKTLAVVLVHWGGNPCDLDKVNEIKDYALQKFGNEIFVIEDCAHALGAEYKQKLIGNSSNFCVFSFQAVKPLTTGDGGLVVCPNQEFHKKIQLLRWYGFDRESSLDYRCEQDVENWGFKFHMNDVAATIGLSNFSHLQNIIAKHRENHNWLQQNLRNNLDIDVVTSAPNTTSSNWIMTVFVESRDNFMQKMKSAGIQVSRVHNRNDKYTCLKDYLCELPATDLVCDRMCCIPCGWWVSAEDREYIVDQIKGGW